MILLHGLPIQWSKPSDVSKGFGAASGSLPGPGTALEASGGRVWVISHHGAYQRDYLSYSDDHGMTWATSDSTFPHMDEAAITELPDGELLVNMRHTASPAKGRAISRSTDGGMTWSPISYDPALISPVCQGSIVSFNNATVSLCGGGRCICRETPTDSTRRRHSSTFRIPLLESAVITFPFARALTTHGPGSHRFSSKQALPRAYVLLYAGQKILSQTQVLTLTLTPPSHKQYSCLAKGEVGRGSGKGGLLFEGEVGGTIMFGTFPL